MRKLIPRFISLPLAFIVGVSLYFAWHGVFTNRQVGRQRAEVFGILVPVRESNPLLETEESRPVASSNYMMLAPQPEASGPDINEPVPEPTPDLDHIKHSCGLLIISVGENRRLKLNSEDIGALADLESLNARLTQIFSEREANRAFKPGMERRDDFPMAERIEKTTVIQPSQSLTYGEVVILMDEVGKTGAKPINVQVSDLKN